MTDPVAAWHEYMESPSVEALAALLDEDVVFQSPAVHTPQVGKAITLKYLGAAAVVLGGPGFRYTGEWRGEHSAVLEFECEVAGNILVNGVDILHWNEAGRITNFKVMIRPMRALNAVVPLMAAGGREVGRVDRVDVRDPAIPPHIVGERAPADVSRGGTNQHAGGVGEDDDEREQAIPG